LGEAAARQGRVMNRAATGKRRLHRVDSFEFAKAGVPVLHAARGIEIIGQTPEYGSKKRDEFVENIIISRPMKLIPAGSLRRGAGYSTSLRSRAISRQRRMNSEWKAAGEFKVETRCNAES